MEKNLKKILADQSYRSAIAFLFLLKETPSHSWVDKQENLGDVLGISRPTTCLMIRKLKELGYIRVEKMQGTRICSITLC